MASSEQASDFHAVVTLADEALLLAKSAGRYKIIVAGQVGSVQSGEAKNPAYNGEPSPSPIDELVDDMSALSPIHLRPPGKVISE